ncbi:hypothetical protein GA0115252_17389, partial [Streptomyces sp. DfronAA-171]
MYLSNGMKALLSAPLARRLPEVCRSSTSASS